MFLDAVAGVAWLELKVHGKPSETTMNDLALFDRLGAHGRKTQFLQEGFIPTQ